MNIVDFVLMGIFATFFMDILAKILTKRKIIYPVVRPEAIGRWFLYMFKGKFFHNNINEIPQLKNEKLWAAIAHYLIGVALAGIYLFLELQIHLFREMIWMPVAFGISTSLLPWCWLFPALGLGFFAEKTSNSSLVIRTSLINHTNFGIGLLIWNVTGHILII